MPSINLFLRNNRIQKLNTRKSKRTPMLLVLVIPIASLELRLDLINNVLIYLESLHKNITWNIWGRPKQRICNCNNSWILAASPAMATALAFLTFCWKCIRPTVKANTSPLLRVFVMKWYVFGINGNESNFKAAF